MQGKVILKDCLLESQLDDGLNIHGNYAEVDKIIDEYTLGAKIVHRQQKGYRFAMPGDSVRLIDRKTLLSDGQYFVVRNVRYINDSYFEIVTKEPIKSVLPGMGLDNITWSAQLEMTGCSVGKNWARSVLIKTPGKSIISNNRFYSTMQGIRNWGEMIWFYESGNVNDVLISGNEFIDLCRVGMGLPVILIHPQIKGVAAGGGSGFYNRNIKIVNNVIKTFDRGILYAFTVDGLTFENNTIIRSETFKPLSPDLPVIKIENCKNINISNNHYNGTPRADIVLDNISKASGRIKNNKGFTYISGSD